MVALHDKFMPLWIADYLADTPHLTRDQHGGYLLLLMAYWRNGGPLSADNRRLAAICKANLEEWLGGLRAVLSEFFHEENGLWHNKRADAELVKARRIAEARQEAGKIGGRASSNRRATVEQSSSGAEAMLKQKGNVRLTPSPSPSLSKKVTKIIDSEPSVTAAGSQMRTAAKRATAWPVDGVVSEAWREDGIATRLKFGLPEVDMELEAERFRTHWLSNGKKYIDWHMTWLNWARGAKAARYGKAGSQNPYGNLGEIAAEELAKDAVRNQDDAD